MLESHAECTHLISHLVILFNFYMCLYVCIKVDMSVTALMRIGSCSRTPNQACLSSIICKSLYIFLCLLPEGPTELGIWHKFYCFNDLNSSYSIFAPTAVATCWRPSRMQLYPDWRVLLGSGAPAGIGPQLGTTCVLSSCYRFSCLRSAVTDA